MSSLRLRTRLSLTENLKNPKIVKKIAQCQKTARGPPCSQNALFLEKRVFGKKKIRKKVHSTKNPLPLQKTMV